MPSTSDFLGEVGLNLAFYQVTSYSSWKTAMLETCMLLVYLRSMSISEAVKFTRIGMED